MPKANNYPLSILFGINKPTGPPSMIILNKLQPLFSSSILFQDANGNLPSQQSNKGSKWSKRGKGKKNNIKIGQGGTLDPLADGVLVVGTNNATKHLAQFLDCTKEYKAIGLFGCATDSYDSEGKRVKLSPFNHITKEKIEAVLDQFRGEISQVPPIFSALKMDGKPLYEYARSGIPLPRPIASRKVTVHSLNLINFKEGNEHTYKFPEIELGEVEKLELMKLQKMVQNGETVIKEVEEEVKDETKVESEVINNEALPPTFEISMTVSSGTYVRSIIHDIGIALGSSAHVVKLTRTRQGIFTLNDNITPIASTSTLVSELSVVESIVVPVEVVAEESIVPVPEASTSTLPSTEEIPASIEEVKPVEAAVAVVPELILETFSGGCVEWEILEEGIKQLEASQKSGGETLKRNEEGFLPWEVEILHRCKHV